MESPVYPLNYSPGLIVETYPLPQGGKTFVCQDSCLFSGTKQRGLPYFHWLYDQGYQNVVIVSSTSGYSQVATSWACFNSGLKAQIVLKKEEPRSVLTDYAYRFGATLIEITPDDPRLPVPGQVTTTGMEQIAQAYADEYNKQGIKSKFIKTGLHEEAFISFLAENIRQAASEATLLTPEKMFAISLTQVPPRRLWLVCGSGTLLQALATVWPDTEFLIVAVGFPVYSDLLTKVKTYKIYRSRYKYNDNVTGKDVPPYQALLHYDAKIWAFVTKYGLDGDFIWNVK